MSEHLTQQSECTSLNDWCNSDVENLIDSMEDSQTLQQYHNANRETSSYIQSETLTQDIEDDKIVRTTKMNFDPMPISLYKSDKSKGKRKRGRTYPQMKENEEGDCCQTQTVVCSSLSQLSINNETDDFTGSKNEYLQFPDEQFCLSPPKKKAKKNTIKTMDKHDSIIEQEICINIGNEKAECIESSHNFEKDLDLSTPVNEAVVSDEQNQKLLEILNVIQCENVDDVQYQNDDDKPDISDAETIIHENKIHDTEKNVSSNQVITYSSGTHICVANSECKEISNTDKIVECHNIIDECMHQTICNSLNGNIDFVNTKDEQLNVVINQETVNIQNISKDTKTENNVVSLLDRLTESADNQETVNIQNISKDTETENNVVSLLDRLTESAENTHEKENIAHPVILSDITNMTNIETNEEIEIDVDVLVNVVDQCNHSKGEFVKPGSGDFNSKDDRPLIHSLAEDVGKDVVDIVKHNDHPTKIDSDHYDNQKNKINKSNATDNCDDEYVTPSNSDIQFSCADDLESTEINIKESHHHEEHTNDTKRQSTKTVSECDSNNGQKKKKKKLKHFLNGFHLLRNK